MVVTCGSCGCVHPAVHRCEQRHCCDVCGRRYWRRTQRRMLASLAPIATKLARRSRRAPVRCDDDACGCRRVANRCRWELRLWTLTVPHSGELATDLERLQRGWQRLRGWLSARGFRSLDWVKVLECTESDGGHLHAHVIIGAPPICYAWMRREWRLCIDAPDALGVDVQRPKTLTVHAAARYVASYATKGSQLPVAALAKWLPTIYGRRMVSAARGALEPHPPAKCPEPLCGAVGTLARQRDSWSADSPRGPP